MNIAPCTRFLHAVLGFVALGALAGAQTTWYVDAAGTPPGTGTLANPYTSIQYAITQPTTVTGDTLSVAPGTYTENLLVSKRVLIEATGGPDVTQLRAATHGNLVRAGSPDGIPIATLRGFTLDGASDPTGVGIHVQNATLRIEHCVIRDFASGRGVNQFNQYLDAFSSTIVRNAIGVEQHLAIDPGQVSLISCIVQGNGIDFIEPNAGSALNIHYSAVPAGFPGGPGSNNIFVDPQFWDPAEGDFHLRPGSPCIDAGPTWLPLDPDGTRVDMGGLTYSTLYAPGPIVYCTPKTNSQGCVPAIAFAGEATSTGSLPFDVWASQVLPLKPGMLLVGPGKNPVPFQGAWLCLQTPIKRIGGQISTGAIGCDGTYTFDLAAYIDRNPQPLFAPGELAACQWWGRDPGDPNGGSQLTDALYFGIAP